MIRFLKAASLAGALLLCPFAANAAGTINLSLSQQFDTKGVPLGDCRLYFFQAGTTTPQNAYLDTDLTLVLPNPLRCDASGRIPQFFLADGTIKIRLTDKNGVEILAADGLLVIGPSSGGGGGSPVDPSTIYQTGDIKVRWGTGTHDGWVRAAGRTIGSASSGASERASADTQALWEYLCTNDTTLQATISGGYTSCAADYAANKTIQLPDYRGSAIAGLGDMGNTATSVLTTTYCGADPTTLGQFCGVQSSTLVQDNLPNITVNALTGGVTANGVGGTPATTAMGTGGAQGYVAGNFSAIVVPLGGTDTAFSRIQPTRLATIYIKL